MVNDRSKRLSAAATASVDFPNLVTHSLGRGGRGLCSPAIVPILSRNRAPMLPGLHSSSR